MSGIGAGAGIGAGGGGSNSSRGVLDQNLRYLSVRSSWGCQPLTNNIMTIDDKEYLVAVGSRVVIHEEDQGPYGSRKLLYPGQDVESVVALDVSPDKKFIAVCVRKNVDRTKATILIYDVEAERSYPKPPRQLQHEDSSSELFFLGTKFSHDSRYLACFTPRHYVGIIVYDWKVEKIVATIQIKSLATSVSFNPSNSTRLCVTGACGLFQFWHFTTKSTYSAPINGLNRTDISITCHEWLGSDTVVGGTDKGQIYLIVGCETKQLLHIFGSNLDNTHVNSSVASILVKDSLIVAYSSEGYVALVRFIKSEGRNSAPHLKLESFFLLKDTYIIHGISWCEKRMDSMSIVATGVDSTYVYQLPIAAEPSSQNAANGTNLAGNILIFTPHMLKKHEITEEDGVVTEDEADTPHTTRFLTPPQSSRAGRHSSVPALPRSSSSDRHKYVRQPTSEISNALKRLRLRWPYLLPSRHISSHHSGMITTLATNPRASLLITSSPIDMTIKTWDYNRVGGDALVASEDYTQKHNEYPNTIDMHPSGFFFVAGTDEHVVEYAITDSKYEALRRIPIKTAVLSPTGEPIMNTSPVSIVKYSYGGHLIAVATGRLIQIFEVYNLNYNSDKTGTPERMIIFNDHIANITDLTFSKDDLKLFSCAADGAVYEWSVNRQNANRVNDFVMRGVPATHVAVSTSGKYIFATFESEALNQNKYNKSLNRSMSRQNSEWLEENTAQHTERKGGLLMRADSLGGTGGFGRTISNSSDQQTPADRKTPANRSHLAMWKNGILSPNADEILDLLTPVTAIAFGKLDGREGYEIVILGLVTGEIVISMLPVPVKVYVHAPKKYTHISTDVRYLSIASVPTNESTNSPIYPGMRNAPAKIHSSSPYDPDEVDSDNDEYNGLGNHSAMGNSLQGEEHTHAISGTGSYQVNAASERAGTSTLTSLIYDESLCRILALHEGTVAKVLVSASGLWIWSCGVDGCIFMINTNLKAKDQVDVLEAISNENHISLTDKMMLKTQQNRLEDKESLLEEMAKEKKHSIHQLEVQREKEKKLLEDTMAREISKRDDIIVQGRNELQAHQKKTMETINSLHTSYKQQLAELEVVYEKKLAHETIYIQNMKQAYDEYVTHIRFDLEGYQKKAQIKEEKLIHEKEEIIEETEKQKKLLLEYTDYIGERHREVLKSLTEAHDEQKYRLNLELEKQNAVIDQIKYQNRQEETKTLRQMQILKQDMQTKDMEVLNTAQELERMRDRAQRLENALQNAMAENQRKQEAAARWEFKSGEQQQQLNELERVRKALISQLHSLREEAGPKEIQIIKMSEKLNELEKQYEKSLKAISDKEQHLQQNSTMVHLLHKQVRELRSSLIQRESSLKRAAKLLDEFKYSLQQARFASRKVTLPHGHDGDSAASNDDRSFDTSRKREFNSKKHEVVELISSTPVMEESLQRLHDVLNPHSTDEDVTDDGDKLVIQEKERQIDLMRRNINSLRTNIKLSEDVAIKKVHNYLTDNEHLLYEMNQLRHEIGYLREENERLHAAIGMGNTHRQSKKALTPLQKGGGNRPSVNNVLPDFPLKRNDSDILPPESELGLSNISLIQEEMLVRSRGSNNVGLAPSGNQINSTYQGSLSADTPYIPGKNPINDQDDNDSMSNSMQTSSYQRADEIIAELFASNQERIMEESMKREAHKTRLIQEANTLGSPVTQNIQSKEKKGKAYNPTFDVTKIDHRLGPAVRRKQDLSNTAPLPESGKIKLSSTPSTGTRKKDITNFSMTGSQLPNLVKKK